MIKEVIVGATAVVISASFGFIAWSFKKTIIEKLDALFVDVEKLNGKLDSYREDVLRNYPRKEDLPCAKEGEARAEMWKEINNLRERIAKVEK